MSLASQYDQTFKRSYDSRLIEAYDQTYREAVKLMSSPELKVFDIKQRTKRFARCTAKTRSAKVVCSRVAWFKPECDSSKLNSGSWDHHQDIFNRAPKMIENLDNALGALIAIFKKPAC